MTQIPLDFAKRARRTDPATSHQAAARVIDFAHGHYALIVGSLKQDGAGTIYEIGARIGLSHVQVARRLPELAEAVPAVVVRTAETRRSPSGRPCSVWSLA